MKFITEKKTITDKMANTHNLKITMNLLNSANVMNEYKHKNSKSEDSLHLYKYNKASKSTKLQLLFA